MNTLNNMFKWPKVMSEEFKLVTLASSSATIVSAMGMFLPVRFKYTRQVTLLTCMWAWGACMTSLYLSCRYKQNVLKYRNAMIPKNREKEN